MLLVGAGLVAAAALVLLGTRLADDPVAELPPLAGGGTLDEVPEGPVEVVAETVRLRAGFRNRHHHGGPTFNHIISGLIRLTAEDGTTTEYGAGDFFFEPADRPHTIEVLDPVRIDVLRLVPDGREPTRTLE